MDPVKNPFSPGAGSRPPELAGRDAILEEVRVLLGRVRENRTERSIILVGLRGVGKTVLLSQAQYLAGASCYRTIHVEAREERRLAALIAPELRTTLVKLYRRGGSRDKVRHAIAILRSFMSTLDLTVGESEVGLGIEPAVGAADCGDLEVDLPIVLVALGEAAKERECFIAIIIDEMHFFNRIELTALSTAMNVVQQRQLPVVLLGAGLPSLLGLVTGPNSYAEQLFNFEEIGALSREDTRKALQNPVMGLGVSFDETALNAIYRLSMGYPYLIQEWGYQAWNLAGSSPIRLEVIQEANTAVLCRLDRFFFGLRYSRLAPAEKRFLRAMADLGPGPSRSRGVAERLGARLTSLGPIRSRLIKKGMVYSPSHGDIAFTVPVFDEFMKRAIPELAQSGREDK